MHFIFCFCHNKKSISLHLSEWRNFENIQVWADMDIAFHILHPNWSYQTFSFPVLKKSHIHWKSLIEKHLKRMIAMKLTQLKIWRVGSDENMKFKRGQTAREMVGFTRSPFFITPCFSFERSLKFENKNVKLWTLPEPPFS